MTYDSKGKTIDFIDINEAVTEGRLKKQYEGKVLMDREFRQVLVPNQLQHNMEGMTEGMVVDAESGEIVHYSYLKWPVYVVRHNANRKAVTAMQTAKSVIEGMLKCRSSDGTKCAPNDEEFYNAEVALKALNEVLPKS